MARDIEKLNECLSLLREAIQCDEGDFVVIASDDTDELHNAISFIENWCEKAVNKEQANDSSILSGSVIIKY